jgi:hypothetical protein
MGGDGMKEAARSVCEAAQWRGGEGTNDMKEATPGEEGRRHA